MSARPAAFPADEAILLPLVHTLVTERLRVARLHGPIPPIRSQDYLSAHPDQQTAALLVCGAAWLISDPHRTHRALLRQVSDDVHGGDTRFWRRVAANHVPYTELVRRRAVPGPLTSTGAAPADHQGDRRPPMPADPHTDPPVGPAQYPTLTRNGPQRRSQGVVSGPLRAAVDEGRRSA